MSIEGLKFTPGDEATPQQILMLAHEYRRAADALLSTGRKGNPLSRAPYRFVAIQAIELYLSAYLRARGRAPADLRRMGHDVDGRTVLAAEAGLPLREKTKADLKRLSQEREYSIMRYGPEMRVKLSPPNRMYATLNEVAKKVTAAFVSKRGPAPSPGR